MNVVGRKRVQARKDLIRRAQNASEREAETEEKGVTTSYDYVYKHSIVVDSKVPSKAASTEAYDTTTYDIHDIAPGPEEQAVE